MKSKSASTPQAPSKWRLSRTLSRKVESRAIEMDDLKYLWAAYKKGALSQIFENQEMPAAEFREAFESVLIGNFHGAWVVVAETKNGFIPCGMVLGNWHPISRVMVISGIAWFPWASCRNIVEGTVHFFNEARRDIPMTGYARHEHKRLYEMVAKHGVMRRVGTSYNFFEGEPAAIFETRGA